MTRSRAGLGAAIGALLTAPLIAALYLGHKLLGLPFPPYDLFDWVTRILPGPLVTFGLDIAIDSMRMVGLSVANTAKTAELVLAFIQFFVIGVVGGVGLLLVMVRFPGREGAIGRGVGTVFGVAMTGITLAIGGSGLPAMATAAWLIATFFTWGASFSAIAQRLVTEPAIADVEPPVTDLDADDVAEEPESPATPLAPAFTAGVNRREFIVRVGAAAAAITVVSGGLGALLANAARREAEAELADSVAHMTEVSGRSPFPNANDAVMPAPGTRPEYTPLKDHYKVFIRTQATVIDGATWTLPITGLVSNPVSMTIEDLRANYESRDQYVTLSCISGRIGTDLISTTQWTGVSLQKILADVQPMSRARYLQIGSGDGFYETVDLDLIASDERIMLTYAWDGNPIPIDHGFPLRIWLPDRYGMKQPKWITDMALTEEYRAGYWVERGWDEVARVRATSVIDTIAGQAAYESGGRMLVPVGGIAFAGARGISKVEIRVDDGPWQPAQLRTPLSETTWVLWRYDWPFEAGRHVFEVRCAEADGTPQIEDAMGNRPSGATGVHRRTERL